MGKVYIYCDETGTLDYEDPNSEYFGIGTATFTGTHADAMWEGFDLRTRLEARGLRTPKGVHAKNDSRRTRGEVFELIKRQAPRFDTTFLYKPNAYDYVRARGPVYLYKTAFYQHFKYILYRVSNPGDEVFVIAGHLQTNSKRDAIYDAVRDVCSQLDVDRTVVACVWEAPSSWGIQVADYGLWSVQRELLGKGSQWHSTCVEPFLETTFRPWGRA
ncbi:DUF3800 domain-containing protein [Janibacter sp. Y6]|uniref:DUF3800 domain-containing protein n=1 Tax=Janibacter sp. Y6 TaxID=2913552 RepID=UPI0034A3C982